MKRLFHSLLLLLLLCAVSFAAAGEEEQFDVELVVTATKIPQEITEAPGMVYTIDQEEIAANQSKSVAEILTHEGFTISTHGGEHSLATISLDGTSAVQNLIMIDGVPIHGGSTGNVDLSCFPLTGVETIEIVKGPLSALYGANALGGVVNIIPNLTGEPGAALTLSAGSFLSGRTNLTVSRENWGLALGGSTTEGHLNHSATNSYYFAAQYNPIDTPDGFLKIYSSFRAKDAQIPGSHPGNQDDRNIFLSLTGKKELSHGYLQNKTSYQNWYNFYEDLSFLTKDQHKYQRFGTDLTYFYATDNHRLLGGLSYNYDLSDSTATGSHRRHEIGFYLQDLWDLNDYLLLHSGVRMDKVDQYQTAFSPRLGLTWFIADHFNLGINYGSAFRVPTINEYWYGNPELKPEQGHKLEVTVHWKESRFSLRANLAHSQLQNGIIWVDHDSDGFTDMPENIEKLKTWGFSLEPQYNWGPVKTSLGYTYLDKRGWDPLTGDYDRNLNHFGQHQLNLKVQAKFGNLGITSGYRLVANRSKQMDWNSGEEVSMPDYHLLSTALDYQFNEHCTLDLALENLTGTKYEIHRGYPMPGRNFRLNLNIRY